jgi:predicted SAM-dependent methyltransferase
VEEDIVNVAGLIVSRIPTRLKPHAQKTLNAYRRFTKLLGNHKINKIRSAGPLKLNVGCGQVKLPGWVNIDVEPGGDLIADARKKLPFNDGRVDFIYNEHLLEHLTYEEGEKFLLECYRCLKESGVLRIAMPDLDYLIRKYNDDWANQDWLTWPGFEFIKTKGRMINVAFRHWGHQYLYNEEDLRNRLIGAGFKTVSRCNWNVSAHSELTGLETRKDSILVMEAEK